jgi:2-oxo-4-hydroxy-4-carboxy-5-ureidoimidazoline decarboxylase
MADLSNLNALSAADFVSLLGGVYEHSPWVAESVAALRPFSDRDDLIAAMRSAVEAASDEQKLALIRAHPDLAGKLARAGGLTDESKREQAGLGLDRLSDAEFEAFTDFNERYRERFGFPFIICARLTTKQGVLQAFARRIGQTSEEEMRTALQEIHHIARLRMLDLVE